MNLTIIARGHDATDKTRKCLRAHPSNTLKKKKTEKQIGNENGKLAKLPECSVSLTNVPDMQIENIC